MTDETKPYVRRAPGALITAEDWNEVQVKIREDIQNQVKAAKEQTKEIGVSRADNADRFGSKTPQGWIDELDQRYALKVHDQEELAAYRRYHKQMEPMDTVVLQHNLGRFPLVDLYELQPILPAPDQGDPIMEKFYLYYHHEERDRSRLYTRDRGRVRWPWGTPLERLLGEYPVEWDDDDSLGDVVNDFLEAFFAPPNDHMAHRTSLWIDDKRDRTIAELKRRDEWPDIYWVVRPQRLIAGSPLSMSVIVNDARTTATETALVNICHLSYDTLEVTAADDLGTDDQGNAIEVIDLMILLRS